MESMKDYEKELEASFRKISEGDIIKGTVIDVNEEEVILDLKYYTQGIIKAENLSNDPDYLAAGKIAVGDEIEATVVRMDDGEGNIELSKKEANDVLAWDKLQELMEEEQTVKVRIKESVPSGVMAYLEGIRAFIPASQIASDYVEDTDAWVGREIEAKVITVDRDKTKLVLSGKAVAREKEAEARKSPDFHDGAGNGGGRRGRTPDALWCFYQPWKRHQWAGAYFTDLPEADCHTP